ncbi:MAG: NAD-dependent epimerase/dehydratase family protein [Ignavibacteria bacterium]|nr:NAD-dependent epimerase/dehydratase family protein [Ignavibacteria bacterium]
MDSILITGINGFLGSEIAKMLSTTHKIVGVEKQINNLSRISGENFKIYSSSLQDIKKLFLENDITAIVHTATIYGRNNENELDLFYSNMVFPLQLLSIAIAHEIPYFINTDTTLDRFTSAYSLTKKQFHDWLYFYKEKIKIINLELQHFYGPGCPDTNFVIALLKRLMRNEKEIALTPGDQLRDFIYSEDVIQVYKKVIDSLNNFKVNYTPISVGTGVPIELKSLVQLAHKICQSESKLLFGALPYRENEVMYAVADLTSNGAFNWDAKTGIETGLIKTVRYLQKENT